LKTILQYSILLFAFIGCTDHVNEPAALNPYEQWRSYKLHDYTIEQIRVCYCATGGVKMTVTVRSDTVFSVMRISDSTVVPYPTSKLYFSIDSLFGIIQHPKGDSLVIVYNAQYGFPEKLDINPQEHPVDGGVLYETNNLQPKK
jgi:hypothetical protein